MGRHFCFLGIHKIFKSKLHDTYKGQGVFDPLSDRNQNTFRGAYAKHTFGNAEQEGETFSFVRSLLTTPESNTSKKISEKIKQGGRRFSPTPSEANTKSHIAYLKTTYIQLNALNCSHQIEFIPVHSKYSATLALGCKKLKVTLVTYGFGSSSFFCFLHTSASQTSGVFSTL